jgi:hypothetical protein|tara:strand:+ start:1053 stop:1334 length:282 start_codon:yes stop_codon:yes gene_type:complete
MAPQYLTDEQLTELIDTLTDVYQDYLAEDIEPISVASVMLAVAVKQLQRTLDKDEFRAIIEDLTQNQFSDWAELPDDEYSLVEYEPKKKRIIH